MDDNVIYLADQLRRRRVSDGSDRGSQDAEEKLRARELMRLRQIESACQGKRKGGQLKWLTLDDRLRAATAVGELKNELIARQNTVAATKEIFPKLHRYIIAPEQDLSNEKIAKARAQQLIAKVQPYLAAAKAIAEVANLDLVECQLRILRKTSLWQSWGRPSSENDRVAAVDEAADAVAFLIERLSARILRETNVSDLFARMRKVPGQWNIRTGNFKAAGQACLFGTAYQEWFEMWDEAPPLPSVPLVRLWHASLSFSARLSNGASSEPIAAHEMLIPVALDEGEERPAELHIYREIRLALGPTANADAVGPMFESRVYSELNILDADGKILSQGMLDFDSNWNLPEMNSDRTATVRLSDGWHRVTPLVLLEQTEDEDLANTAAAISGLHVASPFMWDFTPLADEKQCFEQWWLSWTPVDSAHVAHWLDRHGHGRSQPIEFLQDAPNNKRRVSETWYPRASLGHLVEAAISSGRLEAALRSEIALIREAFETHETEWKTRMREQTAEQIAEFDSDLIMVSAPSDEQEKPNNYDNQS